MRGFALLLAAALLTGCGPTLLFVGDPVLAASLFDLDAFERSVDRVAERAGYRARFFWPPQPSLETIDAIGAIEQHDAQVIVLSPYLSLTAHEFSSRFPGRSFFGYYGAAELPNVTWIDFDPDPALREVGRLLAEWVFARPGRRVVAFVDESSPTAKEEAASLIAGYESGAEVGLERVAFSAAPTREDVRGRVRAAAAENDRALVLMLGSATGWALEAARDEDVKLVLRHATIPAHPGQVLYSVQDDLAVGLSAAFRADGPRVLVPSVVRRR